jgi:sphingomyelin phosphodiesterase
MEGVLRAAELNGEYVFIMGHIPPGDSNYLSQCSRRYNALIDRFSYLIRGQFFGHTHYDEFRLVHEYFNSSNVAGLIFTAPSVTTYSNRNPSYRVYDVKMSNNQPIDYTQKFLNITKANLEPNQNPVWEVQYVATKDFNLSSLADYNRFQTLTKDIRVNVDF